MGLPSRDLFAGIQSFGHNVNSGLLLSTAKFAGIWYKSGETNRYTKSPESRIPVELPPVKKSRSLDTFKSEPYVYETVVCEVEIPKIRLLKLWPPQSGTLNGLGNDLIRCDIISCALDTTEKYEALSYTWGLHTRNFPIVISSNPSFEEWSKSDEKNSIPATPQLYAALRRLRHASDPRILWIDQLCINQADDAEKGQQVGLMADIYKKAYRTIVWLGEEDRDRHAIEELATELKETSEVNVSNDIKLLEGLIDGKNGRKYREAITRLLNRSWFSRSWIYQEAVVSSEVIVKCGGLELSLEKLIRLIGAICQEECDSGGYARSLVMKSIGFDTLFLITHGRGCDKENCQRDALMKNDFLGLLMQTLQQFQATDPRDLIYAFLAFEPQNRRGTIVPEYKSPVADVWIHGASSIIKATGSLDIFAAVRGDTFSEAMGEIPCTNDLPSWVPNWSNCFPYARPIMAPDFPNAFNACTIPKHTWIDSENPNHLHVKGTIMGEVTWISSSDFAIHYHRDAPGGTKGVVDLENQLRSMLQYLNFQPQSRKDAFYHQNSNPREALMRTLLADGAFGDTQPLPYPISDLIQIMNDEIQIQEVEDKARQNPRDPFGVRTTEHKDRYRKLEQLREWGLIVQRKKVFLCNGINLGLAPEAIKPRDLICIIHGSKVPCILRRCEGENFFRVISQCYIEGWMYGKAPFGNAEDTFIII